MSDDPSDKLEQQWRATIRQKTLARARLWSFCGPSGTGKTTVVELLTKCAPAFVETTEGNPHLSGLIEHKSAFNALANQQWFLEKVGEHIAAANPDSPLILDQDPAAIVFAYSKLFLDEGKITVEDYSTLVQQLLSIEDALSAWNRPRFVIVLDAPPEVLHRRVLNRQGRLRTPPIQWFERVREYFIRFFTMLPNAVTISTGDLSPEQVSARAKSIMESRTNQPLA